MLYIYLFGQSRADDFLMPSVTWEKIYFLEKMAYRDLAKDIITHKKNCLRAITKAKCICDLDLIY